ncbi:glycosyltransferase [Bifidobacterium sp. ESL0732]|uniref:glycosyltransferase n=1 Tax=Bifidobacterium sp. ESL0732 TaxID=2983222 RepID=UPI0023F74D5D|nr:glycosyltransferase [Bifidobacterium sp. ESL0732]WEV64329.1 glycosyltransferase [Bifidobacterium sp. ESL0732]
MKILIINDTATVIGGAASVAIMTARILADAGNEVVFFAAGNDADQSLVRNTNIHLVLTGQPLSLDNSNRAKGAINGLYNHKAKKMLIKCLQNNKGIQLAHVHSWTKALSSSIFSALHIMKVPTVLTAHDYFLNCPNGGLFNYQTNQICLLKPMSIACLTSNCDKRNFIQKIYRVIRQTIQNILITRKQPCIIHVSDFARKRITKDSPKLNGPVINNPVDYQRMVKVHCPSNHVYAYIGRVDQEKGVDLFCQAVSELNLPARVIGTGDQMEQLSEQYPTIEFVGWIPKQQLSSYLKDVRCCVFPSRWYEAAALTPKEIMVGWGIPMIGSDQSSIIEDIRDNINGLLFKTGDIESLINQLRRAEDNTLIDTLQEQIIIERHHNRYQTQKTYLDELLNTYKNLGAK